MRKPDVVEAGLVKSFNHLIEAGVFDGPEGLQLLNKQVESLRDAGYISEQSANGIYKHLVEHTPKETRR